MWMIVRMKATFLKTIFTDMENMNGKTEEFMKVNGRIIKCKVKGHSYGLMEENMRETILKIESKDLVFLLSKMAVFIKANG